jgi:hypothetical protein
MRAWQWTYLASFRHLIEPEIDGIGQNDGEQQGAIFGRLRLLQMGKVVGETRPAIHFQKQVSDFDVRQQRVGLPYQRLGFFWNRTC